MSAERRPRPAPSTAADAEPPGIDPRNPLGLSDDQLREIEEMRRGRRPLHSGRATFVPNPEDRAGLVAVLRRRDFRMLWIAQAASQLADKFLMFSLLVIVYKLSGSSSEQSVLLIAYTLPSVLLSAPAGVYADRYDKRTLMLSCNVVRALLIMLVPALQLVPPLAHSAWPVLLVTLLFSSAGQVFAPAEAASIPFLVERRQILSATSLFMTTVILTLVLGIPLATIAIKLFGDYTPFYIATALFVAAAGCVMAMRTSLRAAHDDAEDEETTDVMQELRDGLRVLAGNPALRVGLAQLTLALIVVFTIFALGPAYLTHVLDRQPEDTYLVLIPATVGMVGVGVGLGPLSRRVARSQLTALSVVVAGSALIALGLGPDLLVAIGLSGLRTALAVVIALIFGCALGALLIPAFTTLQESTTEETRGRIFGAIFTLINAAVAVPLVLAGGLADAFGVDRAVGSVGIILVVLGVVAQTWGRSRLRAALGEPAPARSG